MTQEQIAQAKAYVEALNRAKEIYSKDDVTPRCKGVIEDLFPEIRESEDERIRGAIIDHLKDCNLTEWAAWLEKQGEQEEPQVYETENGEVITYSESEGYKVIEPIFKVGDWITNGEYTWKIVEVKPLDYILQSQDGNIVDDTISFVDEQFHSFTIEDAKDGDVLVYGDNSNYHVTIIMLFKSMRTVDSAFNHFHIFDDTFRVNSWCDCGRNAHPATKEQRELLFQKMKEAGYEWDVEKKELKKIDDEEVNGEDYGIDGLYHAQRILEKTLGSVDGYQTDDGILEHKAAITVAKKMYKQKPAWSEEDEEMIFEIISDIEGLKKTTEYPVNRTAYDDEINWLKSLKERMKGE